MLTAEKSAAPLVVFPLPQQHIPRYPAVLQSLSGTRQPMALWLGNCQAARQGTLSLGHVEHWEPPT